MRRVVQFVIAGSVSEEAIKGHVRCLQLYLGACHRGGAEPVVGRACVRPVGVNRLTRKVGTT
jgi:hypothetical protein